MQPETLNRSIQPTPTVHPRGFTPTSVQFWAAANTRSAESISRQLEYSSGAAFRRALYNYVGATPTAVKHGGGVRLVLRRFLDACGLGDRLWVDRSIA